ncbi:DUF6457 domain-containing protein [Actinomyces qiguomingii]|uniref:DUF6457 domain-containing protein n=1 Tax=Actinomyces qiguomingii TaxID=2057800 RepID=UPI000CA043F0|nr:DUF6457 domain-containing protein [Actinomyces qiguomingii]
MSADRDEDLVLERMRRWLELVCERLEVDPAVVADHESELLGLVSQVAHGPSRPGAPMTAFVVGYAAAAAARPVSEIVGEVSELVAAAGRADPGQ